MKAEPFGICIIHSDGLVLSDVFFLAKKPESIEGLKSGIRQFTLPFRVGTYTHKSQYVLLAISKRRQQISIPSLHKRGAP
jgi:hypothetical protein